MKQKLITKRNLWKRTVAFSTACQILSYASLPSLGIIATEVAAQEQNVSVNQASANGQVDLALVRRFNLQVRSAILIDTMTGEVIVNVNADKAYPPASMTKMMTEYIVLETVKQGKLGWNDEVVTRKNAASVKGSRIYLAEGDKHKVRDLYIALAIGSANDAAVALAEHIAGSEEEFVKLMNQVATDLGMTKTRYMNATGLGWEDMPEEFRPRDKEETVMSAMDTAKLVRAIVIHHPNFNDFSKIRSYRFRERDTTEIKNLNWMLEANKDNPYLKRYAYQGVDGMKTGFTNEAKYCFAGTAVRGNMRLISVVMGTASKEARFAETAKLFNYGFENFEVKNEIPLKTTISGAETVPIQKGVDKKVPVVTETDVSFVILKGAKTAGKIAHQVNPKPAYELVAPIQKGQQVGTITFTYQDNGQKQTKTVNLIASEKVEKGSWWRLFFRAIGEFFVNVFNFIKNLF